MCLLAICIYSLEKCLHFSIWALCPFLDWGVYFLLLSCMSCLYILEMKPLSIIICNYFPPFYRLYFHFVYGSFIVKKLVNLIRSYLFIPVLISIALGDLRNHWYDLC